MGEFVIIPFPPSGSSRSSSFKLSGPLAAVQSQIPAHSSISCLLCFSSFPISLVINLESSSAFSFSSLPIAFIIFPLSLCETIRHSKKAWWHFSTASSACLSVIKGYFFITFPVVGLMVTNSFCSSLLIVFFFLLNILF